MRGKQTILFFKIPFLFKGKRIRNRDLYFYPLTQPSPTRGEGLRAAAHPNNSPYSLSAAVHSAC